MDISVNENVIEKVRFRDIISVFTNFFAGNKSSESENEINKKLQEVYKTEKELGATDSIANLTKELEMHETPKRKKTTINTDKVNKITVKENINSKNKTEKQEERQE